MGWSWGRVLMFFRMRGVWPDAFIKRMMYKSKPRMSRRDGDDE